MPANNKPDFRKDNLSALSDLFLQVLGLCQRTGMVKLGHAALDATKVRANASRHKAMSYSRMKEKEAQLAAAEVAGLRRAQEADDKEDRRYGGDKRGDELPEELAFREGHLREIGSPGRRGPGRSGPGQSGRLRMVKSILACPMGRRSAASPTPAPGSCPGLGARISSKSTTARRWWTASTR